jgi:protoheme ferro-lyase
VTHVVLLTYGEPPSAAFAPQLAYSWRILWGLTRRVAPLPPFVLPFIALLRARFRVALWRRNGYSSPIEAITNAQAQALEAILERGGQGPWRVHVAYEFRRPLLADRLAALPPDEPVAVLPMYVAESEFTHDIVRSQLAARSARPGGGHRARVVPGLDPEVLGALSAHHILAELSARGREPGPDWALVLAAHGTLLAPPRPMNTGQKATEAVADAIARRLGPRFGCVRRGWLNHTMGGEWTTPAVDTAVRGLVAEGFHRLVYFPYGFLADNAESQLEGRMILAAQPGLADVEHLPCLNASAPLAAALAESARRTLAGSPFEPKAFIRRTG